MTTVSSALLTAAGTASLIIAVLQFVMYFGGPSVYRWCGTPESWIAFRVAMPTAAFFVEVILALFFAALAAYAYSAVGIIRPLPWLATGLAVTAVIYLGRGLLVIPQLTWMRGQSNTRDVVYSCIALAVGVTYALPTYWHWRILR